MHVVIQLITSSRLIFKVRLDTAENWKLKNTLTKIIFKCVNSTMGSIFNKKKVAEKWDLWVPCTIHRTHWCAKKGRKSQTLRLLFMNNAWTVAVTMTFVSQRLKRVPKKKKKKKKKKNARRKRAEFFNWIQT